MSDAELRVAVVGGWGHFSISPGLTERGNARLVAIAGDGKDESARKLLDADLGKGLPYFKSYKRMLDQVKPDIVSVGVQPTRYARVIVAALERGMQVVSDKPVVNNARELEKVRALLQANPKLNLLTEFTMRIQPCWMAMRDAVRAGKIGEVVLIQAQKSYRFGPSRPDFYKTRKGFPGTVMFVGAHVIDLAWWITGLKFAAALGGFHGNIAKRDYGEFDDHAAVMFRLQNGAGAVMHMDFLRPQAAPTHGDDRMRIAGSKGVVEVRDERCVLITQEQGPQDIGGGPGENEVAALEMLATFRGAGKGVFTTADSLYIADVLLKARTASDKGRTIQLAEK